jgi:hypothetical protein
MIHFNFGPIARTKASNTEDTINLASFPLHVMLNALVGSTSVEEFIAWLWHDLYKPAFYWVSRGSRLSWYHVPGRGAFQSAGTLFATQTGVQEVLVSTHHDKKPAFALRETDFISDQGDQVNLGAAVNYIQLSFAAEPALPTLLARSVIANAFIEVVTKDVASALQQAFITDGRTPIERVRFEFETTSKITFSSSPTDDEIWNKVGQRFDVRMAGNTFIMRHLTPVADPKHEPFATTFTADLTGKPLLPDEMLSNTVSLAELLVLYQDSRTVIIAVPQSQLYTIELPKIRQATLNTSRQRLEQDFNVLTKKDNVDYLEAAFDTQIEIRDVPGRQPKRTSTDRSLNDVVQCPSEMLAEARSSSDGRLCCLTGTWFKTDLPESSLISNNLFKPTFVDTEFVGVLEDAAQQRYLAPLTYLYVINSSGAGKGEKTRKAFRGSFAFLAPASHFAIDEQGAKAVEQPLLDKGGRFRNQLNRVTVTTQEFTLFQQMSRRIIAKLWQSVASPNEHLPLPYLCAIALTHDSKERIRNLLPQLDILFSDVSLRAYPFEVKVNPAIEVALETAIHDQKHAGKHTLLKTTPHLITVSSNSTIPLLVDDDVQVGINRALFERVNFLAEITNELTQRKKKVNQKDIWLKLVLAGSDPVTAVSESTLAVIDTKKPPKAFSLNDAAFHAAEDFWEKHIGKGDFAESWEQYERLSQSATNALEEFPALRLLLQALQKPDEDEGNDS